MTASPWKTLRIAPVLFALSIGAGLVAGCGSSSSASEPPATSAPPVRHAAGVSEGQRRGINDAIDEMNKQADAAISKGVEMLGPNGGRP